MKRVTNKNGKFNYITDNGDILYKSEWLDFLGKFYNGYANIQTSKGWNWIDMQGHLLFPNEWFQSTETHIACNIAIVHPFNGKWQFRKLNGDLLTPLTFDYYDRFQEGFAEVYDKQKGWNFIDTKGNILSPNMWFDSTDFFENDFGVVFLKQKGWNLINTKGNLLSPNMWFDEIIDYLENENDVIKVRVKNDYYTITAMGEIQKLS